jgi:HD-GYP domain-containing protein (c-di-GMP phosphodiesterase class II)
MGWGAEDLERARFAGWVHDIGKIGIRDQFLYKEGPLTPEERRTLEEHTLIGERILATSTHGFERILPAVRHHHERWDGRGYPDGLAGESIPLLARMVGIADSFDAMTTERPYSRARGLEAAIAVLHEDAGTCFDPALVPLFARAVERERPGAAPAAAPRGPGR